MSADQMDDAVLNLKKERFNLRFQRATGQLENTSRMREGPPRHRRIKTIAAQARAKKKLRDSIHAKTYPSGRGRQRQASQDGGGACRPPLHPSDLQEDDPPFKNYHAHDEDDQFKPGDNCVDRGKQADLEIEALDGRPGQHKKSA